uniref:Uncharacterized protein n=1 Tax=Amphimedon queenslandica TaxID=400682 RepID=A0A1X7T2S6_AMPQE
MNQKDVSRLCSEASYQSTIAELPLLCPWLRATTHTLSLAEHNDKLSVFNKKIKKYIQELKSHTPIEHVDYAALSEIGTELAQ